MAIDKTIRIQDLPVSDFLNSDNLIIVNDSDNITRSVTFENLIGSITELPGGISLPITEPGKPGLGFCEESGCDTGIGSNGECNIYISTCGTNIIDITGPLVTINGDLELDGDLVVDNNTFLKGDVNIGVGCSGPERFVVNSKSTLNCDTDILGNVTIGTAPCSTTLEVNSKTEFKCVTDFENDVNFDQNITIKGDITLGGNIKPPPGGSIDVIFDDVTINGEIVLGNPGTGCNKDLEIYNTTFFFCDAHSDSRDITLGGAVPPTGGIPTVPNIKLESLTGEVTAKKFIGYGSLITNLNIPGSLTFKGNIDVTDPNSAALTDPQTGDLYINAVLGLADAAFVGIANKTVQVNRFVFYTAFGEWDTGSLQDQDGFVTLSTPQTVTGNKTFDGDIQSKTPPGTNKNEVVNVNYLEIYTRGFITDNFVTIGTDQTITSVKTFGEIAYGTTPPDTGTTGKELVTIEYLTQGGLISPWEYKTTLTPPTKILSPVVNDTDVKMIVNGSGKFGHIDLSGLPELPTTSP